MMDLWSIVAAGFDLVYHTGLTAFLKRIPWRKIIIGRQLVGVPFFGRCSSFVSCQLVDLVDLLRLLPLACDIFYLALLFRAFPVVEVC